MKIINPASSYYNKFSTARANPYKGGAAESGKTSAGVINLASDIYKMGNSNIYAAFAGENVVFDSETLADHDRIDQGSRSRTF